MTTFNVREADAQLRELLRRVTSGEEIVIADEGKPVAVILSYAGLPGVRVPGNDAGRVVVHDDFDEPLPEFDL